MRRQHRAGEALEVDYAGMTLSVIDKDVVRQAQVFVACLQCSDLTYAEASWTQGHEDWLGAHVRAFRLYRRLPEAESGANSSRAAGSDEFLDRKRVGTPAKNSSPRVKPGEGV